MALLSCANYSMSIIFQNRPIDYYIYSNWPDVNAKAVELIIKDEYDFILAYNANYDDVLHKKGPEGVETLAEMRFNYQTYCMFDTLIKEHWGKHNTLMGFAMDHGCHETPDGKGTHGDIIPEDMNILHLYKIHPAQEEKC